MLQNNIPVNETFWSLVSKADKKFSKIGNLPFNERTGYDVYFCKVFKVYTQLWKFQQENRQKLVEAGLKRWEIGEIASRIGQLYFGQYMRTSQASYLTESYIFYEAILSREYFKEGLFQDLNLANKQLRFLARFMMVCLVLNRREMVHQLVNQLKMLVDDCKKTFQESDFREWKTVVQEILKFQKADTAFMNLRPLRYSIVLDPHPAQLSVAGRRSLKLRDAILSSYYPNEVKFSELTLDTFRMLQCLEWEPSGSLYQSTVASLIGNSQNGAPGPSHINYSQDFTDPTLPPNPRKAMLYRPSVTHFIAVLATICEELASDGILLVYLSALGSCVQTSSSSFNVRTELDTAQTVLRDLQSHTINSDANKISPGQNKGDSLTYQADCLHIGARGHGGINCIYPCDLLPFTRRPLFLVIDSDSSKAFKAISGVEKGERTAMLLSPTCSPPIATVADSSHRRSGSLFTMFLTAPLPAFCLLIGLPGSDSEMEMYNMADKQLSSSLNDWGVMVETSENLDAVWAQVLSDPFLRRLLLRFIFCRAVLTQYAPTFQKLEFVPDCTPSLPDSVLPTTPMCQTLVLQIASIFGAAANNFVFSEGIVVPESTHADEESISS